MAKKCIIIVNEQHCLFNEQKELLLKKYQIEGEIKVPTNGWNLKKIREIANSLIGKQVVFVSPVPALMALMQTSEDTTGTHRVPFKVFHNSVREKKQLPDGRIIQTVAKTGWELV